MKLVRFSLKIRVQNKFYFYIKNPANILTGIKTLNVILLKILFMVYPRGVEPPARGLGNHCSILLSYEYTLLYLNILLQIISIVNFFIPLTYT